MAEAIEANFDGLVGPTHNYGGLSPGNLASARNEGSVSSPRNAVLEGLAKMRDLAQLGVAQGVLPPQERPFIPALRAIGYRGRDSEVLAKVTWEEPYYLKILSSASSMWAANAATVSPSADTTDGRVHFTPANLHTTAHRAIEGPQTQRALERTFPDRERFKVHVPLPGHELFADEGAANHVRLARNHGEPGVELLVWGRDGLVPEEGKFPARQTRQACEAIRRGHGLDGRRTVLAQQSREAIDAGAFHNDVVCVGTLRTLFFHEKAFADRKLLVEDLARASRGRFDLNLIEVPADEVSLQDAVSSYLFNSQLLQVPGEERLVLLAPEETRENAATSAYCERLVAGNSAIGAVRFAGVRESMRNGGGPACLRLRVVLTEAERQAVNPAAWMDEALYERLVDWANRHYRDKLAPADLADPQLLGESQRALDELTSILELGSDFYEFQRN